MLTIHDGDGRLCDGLPRREVLRIGGLGLMGLSLPALLQSRSQGAQEAPGKARSCIVLFLLGGPPQHETWDPKPDAPLEIRGEFGTIPSATPGLRVGELMPRTARLTDRIAVLRAVSTGDHAHSSSGYAMATGVPHQPLGLEEAKPGAPNDWPHMGSIIAELRGHGGGLPPAITLPRLAQNNNGNIWPGQSGGFLGPAADPWLLNCDPAAEDFKVPNLTLPPSIPPLRFDARRSLLQQLDHHRALTERSGEIEQFDHWQHKAFDLAAEPPQVRDRYGRHRFGQSVLLARRLVEAGVSLVQVTWPNDRSLLNQGNWDTHQKNGESLKSFLMPMMDQAYSALLEDLSERGMLDETLVVWMGEFGRTPRINPNGGRDHWGTVFPVALAGGGVRGGVVHGASDRLGAEPREGHVSPADLSATIFHCLGYAPETEIHDRSGRPLPISRGQVIRAVL
jgi:hypothetical protein